MRLKGSRDPLMLFSLRCGLPSSQVALDSVTPRRWLGTLTPSLSSVETTRRRRAEWRAAALRLKAMRKFHKILIKSSLTASISRARLTSGKKSCSGIHIAAAFRQPIAFYSVVSLILVGIRSPPPEEWRSEAFAARLPRLAASLPLTDNTRLEKRQLGARHKSSGYAQISCQFKSII